MGDIDPCTYELITAAADPCKYVETFCEEQWDYLNFIGFYFCQLDQSVPLVIVISLLVVLFVFNFLGTTADTYLAPALETITQKLKLSEAIAGVTLLALANGATDVIAGLVAGGKESGGISIAIGGLFGACLFTVTLVLARCVQGAGEIRVDAAGLKRDVFFLLLATFYFIFLTIINNITWALSLGFFVIYLVFIAYVIYVERSKAIAAKKEAERKESEDVKKVAAQNKWATVREKLLDKEEDDEEAKTRRKKIHALWDQVITPYLLKSMVIKRRNKGLKRGLSRALTVGRLAESEISQEHVKVNEESIKEEGEEEDNSIFGKIMKVYNVPLFFVRNLTMPPFEEENWNVYFAAATPIFGFLFLFWQVKLIDFFNENWYLWVIFGVLAFSIAIFKFIKGRNENLAVTHGGKLAAVTFIVSALWLNLIANCFMDLLSLIKIISGLPLNYLSLTLLAWGNSLDDFFIDYVISKSGHGRMAVIGVYGGQLFNLLVGFGGSMVLQSLKKTLVPDIYIFSGPQKTENILTIVLLISLILGLISTVFVGKLKEWVLGKKMMYFLLFFYLGFLVAVTLITFFV